MYWVQKVTHTGLSFVVREAKGFIEKNINSEEDEETGQYHVFTSILLKVIETRAKEALDELVYKGIFFSFFKHFTILQYVVLEVISSSSSSKQVLDPFPVHKLILVVSSLELNGNAVQSLGFWKHF